MAGVRGLRYHPGVLAANSSSRGVLALEAGVTVSHSGAAVDWHVDRTGRDHCALAGTVVLPDGMDLDTRHLFFRCRGMDLQARRIRLQCCPTGWPSGTQPRPSRTAIVYLGHTRTGPASGLSRTLVRDGGLECRKRTRGLLRADGVCTRYWCSHDPVGRPGTRAALRRRIPRVPAQSACDSAPDQTPIKLRKIAMAIIEPAEC